ncbi:MAG: UDP-3-O-acyl-N-acetylglucosamine deacetylase [Alphaproteobacteria bacterium]|nr:UDP-3-O-acyl-N-acetylglucosamine deacetylase [Alphaproteobacteria bacterium]
MIEIQGAVRMQRTLRTVIDCVGVGVHTGRPCRLVLRPAPAGVGIVFRRVDLGVDIPARFDHVIDTRLCTVLALPSRREASVGTVEHVMAALAALGISNAIVEVDGPEVPILDGSAASFVFLIDCAGVQDQALPERVIAVRRPVRVAQGDAFVELRPASGHAQMTIAMSIAFDDAVIGQQSLSLRISEASFRREIAAARTFGRAAEVAALQEAGLALGGSLDNAVVVDGARVLNPGGLRMHDEFVRHKMLDAVGDIALAGAPVIGRVTAHKSGHALNNRLLRALFADDANWGWVEGTRPFASGRAMAQAEGSAGLPQLGSWQERRLPVAAAPV